MRGKKEVYKCSCCKEQFIARVADRSRGWARFCSKSCKAIWQMKTHGDTRKNNDRFEPVDLSWDAHKFG